MSIGENMKKQRLALGMTLEEVAEKIGVTRQTMSRYETGVIKNYSPETISEIAEALQTTGSYLLGYDETETPINIETEAEKEVNKMKYERIRELRTAINLTREQMAEILGISESALGNYERGDRQPDAELVVKIAQFFKVSSDYILGLSEKPTHEEARLKSCPFCGGEASFYPDYLQCMNCLATMPYRYGLSFEEGKKMATNSWNRRKGG